MFPVEIKFDVEDLGNVFVDVDITVPLVNLAFIQICPVARGQKEKIERLLETPSYLSGCPPQQDGTISEEHMIDVLNPCFEGEARNHSLLKQFVESSTHSICN